MNIHSNAMRVEESPPRGASAPMSREDFIQYLAARAGALDIPLHETGALEGLPAEFHHALAVAHLLEALWRPAPSSELLRSWYGHKASSSGEVARWIYRVVGALRDADLMKLDLGELMSFWVRFENWGAAAKMAAREVTGRVRSAL